MIYNRTESSDRLNELDLIGAHLPVAVDRDIFARHETLVAQAEADLVVVLALAIVEIPLTARLATQPSDLILLARPEAAHAAIRLVLRPLHGIEAAVRAERNNEIVSVGAVALGVLPLARELHPDMTEVLSGLSFGRFHGVSP